MTSARHQFGSVRIWDAHITVGPTAFATVAPEELLHKMDQHGVERSILSPAERWMAVDNREGNDCIVSWTKRWPDRFLGYATANPWFGLRAVQEVTRGLDSGLIGLKFHPGRQGFIVLEPLFAPLMELAARSNKLVYLVSGIDIDCMPLQVAELARRYPTTPIILGRSGRGNFGMMDLLPSVRQASNLYVETVYNFPDTLDLVIETIGLERVVFASDSPFSNLRLELAKLALVRVDRAGLRSILSENLMRLLGMPE